MNWGAPHLLWLLLALPVWAWIALRILQLVTPAALIAAVE